MSEEFEYGPAVRAVLPLILGVAGPTGSGKTFSALRLATGMQRITGGDIALVDTEAKRATAYDRLFKFNHLDFKPPFSPLRYKAAFEYVIKRGAKIVICDSATHEHSGEGGVMDMVDKFLDERCGDDYAKREKLNMLAHKGPKGDRKEFNNFITQAGRGGVHFILCYRADDKVKPVSGQGIVHMGMTPETTSKLVYEMMAMFLLSPAADGRPIANPSTPMEKMFTKLPIQFREMLAAGEPLSETLGQKFAEWARGDAPVVAKADQPPRPLDELTAAGDAMALNGLAKLKAWWTDSLTTAERALLKDKIAPWKAIAEKIT